MDEKKYCKFSAYTQRQNFLTILLYLVITTCFLYALSPTLYGQNKAQVKLLKKAYENQSEQMLFTFFDNWSNEISSNENEAPDKWVAEAHQMFASFYQPLEMRKKANNSFARDIYQDSPYYIVQGSLWKIIVVDTIWQTSEELREYYWKYGYNYWKFFHATMMDSDIVFRSPVHFPDKKIVYLTPKYKKLLDNFLGNKHVELGKHNIMQPAHATDQSRGKKDFICKAATIFYGHWGGYWQYETYPQANLIVFDSKMQRAVVYFRFVYEGGVVILEKKNDEWSVVSSQFIWIE